MLTASAIASCSSTRGDTMPEQLELKDLEKGVSVRSLTIADYDDVESLQLKCFPGMKL